MTLEYVYRSRNFVGAPCIDCDVPGYIVLRAESAAMTIEELPKSAKTELGDALAVLESAIREVTSAEHIYVLRFSEALGSVHFHLFPRSSGLADEFLKETQEVGCGINGPLLFAWARKRFYKSDQNGLSNSTLAVASRIRRILAGFV